MVGKRPPQLSQCSCPPWPAGMEACISNLLEPGDTFVVGDKGIWGERVADIGTRFGGAAHTTPRLSCRCRACDMSCAMRFLAAACACKQGCGSWYGTGKADFWQGIEGKPWTCCSRKAAVFSPCDWVRPARAAKVVHLKKPAGKTFSYDELKKAIEENKPAALFLCQARHAFPGAACGHTQPWSCGAAGACLRLQAVQRFQSGSTVPVPQHSGLSVHAMC